MIKEEEEAKGGVRKVMVTDEVRGVIVLGWSPDHLWPKMPL